MDINANKPRTLRICMLLPDPYEPGMPARPAVREIYGNYVPRMGHEITWIMPANGNMRKTSRAQFGHVEIHVIPYHPDGCLPKRLFHKLAFLRKENKCISEILDKGTDDTLLQVRNNIFEGILAIYLRRKYKVPFVFQYSFPIPQGTLAKRKAGGNTFSCVLAKFQAIALPLVMRQSDLVLPISEGMKENLSAKGLSKSRMMPLPLGVNPDLFSPLTDGETVRRRYGLGQSQLVIYLGTLDKLRQLEVIILSLHRLKQYKPGTKLVVVGDGDDRTNLQNLAIRLGLTNDVLFTGQVPYFEVPQFIAAASIALSPIPPLDIYKVSSPCKLFEYMGMAKPAVANEEIPEHKEVLEASGGGLLIPFTPEGFSCGVMELLDNPEKATEMGRRGRDWVLNNRSYEALARQLEARYQELVKEYAKGG